MDVIWYLIGPEENRSYCLNLVDEYHELLGMRRVMRGGKKSVLEENEEIGK